MIRTKFRCIGVELFDSVATASTPRIYTLQPVANATIPPEPGVTPGNPDGVLRIRVDDANAFEVGSFYYLDSNPVPVEG